MTITRGDDMKRVRAARKTALCGKARRKPKKWQRVLLNRAERRQQARP